MCIKLVILFTMSVVLSVYIASCLHFTRVTAAVCFHSGCYNLYLQWPLQHVYTVTAVAYYVHIYWLLQPAYTLTAAVCIYRNCCRIFSQVSHWGLFFFIVCLIPLCLIYSSFYRPCLPFPLSIVYWACRWLCVHSACSATISKQY
jgi:hypothetical protein